MATQDRNALVKKADEQVQQALAIVELVCRVLNLTPIGTTVWDDGDVSVEHACWAASDLLKAASDNLSGTHAEVAHG